MTSQRSRSAKIAPHKEVAPIPLRASSLSLRKFEKNVKYCEIAERRAAQSGTARLAARISSSKKVLEVPRRTDDVNKSYVVRTIRKIVRKLKPRETVILGGSVAARIATSLGLIQSHLRVLREKFDDIDVDGSGTIDPSEFYEAIGETKSPLSDELFRVMDVDGSKRIDFEEFVTISLVYCMYSKDDILKFCFDLFDADASGAIDEREFGDLCAAVNNGDPLFKGNFQGALEHLDVNENGLIDFEEFKALDRHNPLLFYPAFRMQDRLQKHTLGEKLWVRIMENVAYHVRRRDYEATHGRLFPVSKWDMYKEQFFVRLGWKDYRVHPPVDLDYLASQMKVPRTPTRKEYKPATARQP
ncbi:hypothetical protein CTAYLR_003655 [Chrysophaeum taylorii]|uniref:EF-hand domain-containing protein n=1 Tax=Chrysophaeum taylorii TaxID=2483200 RepID=A0AAD7XNG6_9STRA|nr:hypothetical protein CTAYLR_003655 [Chrysophaeum taylorii]